MIQRFTSQEQVDAQLVKLRKKYTSLETASQRNLKLKLTKLKDAPILRVYNGSKKTSYYLIQDGDTIRSMGPRGKLNYAIQLFMMYFKKEIERMTAPCV